MHETKQELEKAILVTVVKKGADRVLTGEHLDELELLCETAGAVVVEKYYQELEKPKIATMVGKGKVEELALSVKENEISMVVFDDDLSPVQVRNLEKALEVKVMDRSGIILDIFAKRARSLEAKTQVELAQNQYLLPRLTRMWTHLSKQYGGIGTKGPGETQIETDRRMIRNKITHLKKKLSEIEKNQVEQRKKRASYPRFALVGYTNAGKSTLMKIISNADVYVEDKLFATLDTTVRDFELPGGIKAILSDTVGFIRKLPPNLVASFRSTLAEASEADVLLHVVDISNEFFKDHIRVVEETLDSLSISDKPTILVFNKTDLLEDYFGLNAVEEEYRDAVFLSAIENKGIDELLNKMQKLYDEESSVMELLIPYTKMQMIDDVYKYSAILERDDRDEGIYLKLRINDDKGDYFVNTFKKFMLK
jgi:GTP-binding protein HflX